MRSFILISFCLAVAKGAIAPSAADEQGQLTPQAELIKQLEDQALAKEIEGLVANLDEDQLNKLELILSKDLTHEAEFDMLLAELTEMGMAEEDIKDMLDLAEMMAEFLQRVPDLEERLSLGGDGYTLKDNAKLYLLGLPNRLGPLGFLALHSILQANDEIVDVKFGEFESNKDAAASAPTFNPAFGSASATVGAVQPLGDVVTRKRREATAQFVSAKQMPVNPVQYTESPESVDSEEDLVKAIIARRRRAINRQ